MHYTPITPFRRAVDAAILAHQATAAQPVPKVNKWSALRALAAGRVEFGLSDRDMTVLQALVSFFPGADLDGDLIVHPSNRSICERLNGMPESTMRRHLAQLVRAGVILRRDSPNGKRYARRYAGEKVAYGFDLSPLAQRYTEFEEAAEAVRAHQERVGRLREAVSLMRRDLASLAAYGSEREPERRAWDAYTDMAALAARHLRRKLGLEELEDMKRQVSLALSEVNGMLSESEEMIINPSENERHYQTSNTDSLESELCLEAAKADGERKKDQAADIYLEDDQAKVIDATAPEPTLPLRLVLEACGAMDDYTDGPVRSWHDLVSTAAKVRPMMGISPSAWEDARRSMGVVDASIVIVAMLERFEHIRSPGGYLRALSRKAEEGRFSCAPMVMALLRKDAA